MAQATLTIKPAANDDSVQGYQWGAPAVSITQNGVSLPLPTITGEHTVTISVDGDDDDVNGYFLPFVVLGVAALVGACTTNNNQTNTQVIVNSPGGTQTGGPQGNGSGSGSGSGSGAPRPQ